MRIYFVVVILIIGWAIGFLLFKSVGLFILLLVIAVIANSLRVIQGK
jgi:hypothetical protein